MIGWGGWNRPNPASREGAKDTVVCVIDGGGGVDSDGVLTTAGLQVHHRFRAGCV